VTWLGSQDASHSTAQGFACVAVKFAENSHQNLRGLGGIVGFRDDFAKSYGPLARSRG
jgi:hypothetical protein